MEQTRRIRVGDIELECAERGEGERAFVLVHGYTGSRDDWREHMDALSRRGRTVLIDQRGHGGSENPGDPSAYHLDLLRDDLAEALVALGAEGCDLLGHSMGGMVALRLALALPERISSLVLMDTAAHGVDLLPKAVLDASKGIVESQGLPGLAKIMREGARTNPRAAPSAQRAIEKMGFDAWWDRIERKFEQMDPVAFTTLGLALSEQSNLLSRLPEIACPTTVIVGAEDLPFRRPSEELAEGIPGAELRVIPDAAHSPQLENSEAWSVAIGEHLDRVRGTN